MSFLSFLTTANSTGTAGAGELGGSMAGMFLPLVLIFVIFYLFLIRPQNKKQKETEKMINALKKGDKVITIGGIHGTVSSVKENTVIVKVDDDVKLEFNRTAISTVELTDAEKAKLAEEAKSKKLFKGKKSSEPAAEEKAAAPAEENK